MVVAAVCMGVSARVPLLSKRSKSLEKRERLLLCREFGHKTVVKINARNPRAFIHKYEHKRLGRNHKNGLMSQLEWLERNHRNTNTSVFQQNHKKVHSCWQVDNYIGCVDGAAIVSTVENNKLNNNI